MMESPAQMSNEYSGALWEIGDFLFAAKSIAKIAHGKGSWGDAFAAGVSAAAIFIPPLKLGKLAEPALKAVLTESEKMLSTEVVSVVGKRQLEKNIKNATDLLSTQPEFRAQRATQLDQLAPDVVAPIADNTSTAVARIGGGAKEASPPIAQSTGVVKGVDVETLGTKSMPSNVMALESGSTTSATAEKEATRLRELELAKRKSKADTLYSIEDPYGYQKMRERRAFSKEAEQGRKTPNQTDPERNTMPRDAVDDTEHAMNLIDSHESKVQRLSVLHGAVSARRASNPEVDEYFKLIASLRQSGRKYVEAKKLMEDPTSRASVLAEITFTQKLSKLPIADIKTAKAKYTSDAFGVRKFFDKIDEGLTELTRPVQKDIITAAEAEQAGLESGSRMMADSTSDSAGYIEDIVSKKNSGSDAINFEKGIDSSSKFDIGSEAGKYGIGKKPNLSRNTLLERRKDIKFAKRRIAQLEAEVARGVKVNQAKRYVPADELKKAKLELNRLVKELKEASPRNPNAAVAEDQRVHLESFKKHLNPTVDIPGHKGTAPKTVSLLDRIDRVEGFLSKNGRLNLRKKMVDESGKTEKQFFAQIAKYEKELKELKIRSKLQDDKFRETLGKLDEKSMSKVSSWVESLDEAALKRTALKHETFYAQKAYLNKLAMSTTDVAARKRILSVIDKLETESRMGLRSTLAKRSSLQQQNLDKATGVTTSSTTRAIEKKVKLLEAEKIMEKGRPVVHSGGAKGADTAWAEAADAVGIRTSAHSFEKHESIGGFVGKRPALETRNVLSTEQLKENTELVNAAGKVLGKGAGVTSDPGKLVHRNAYQVKDSDAVLAIVSGWTKIADGTRFTVGGSGTPWAVEMGIILKKPVFAFEQSASKWFKFNPETKMWDELDGLPPKFKSFAGIGTRGLKPSGQKAITEYMEHVSGKKAVAVTEGKAEGSVVRWNGLTSAEKNDVVNIGRGGKFGNPFRVGNGVSVKEAVEKYTIELQKRIETDPDYAREIYSLKGKKLACPGPEKDIECHGQSILEAIKYLDKHPELMSKAASKVQEAVVSFRDKYRFLSNMSPSSITIEGIRYPTVEHAFQAAKTTDKELRKKIARAANPAEAKRMGRELTLRSDWNDIRVKAMEYILRKKFEDPKLLKQLLETGERELIEGNTWGDKFWGQVDGEGANNLGKLLMKIRKELMEGK